MGLTEWDLSCGQPLAHGGCRSVDLRLLEDDGGRFAPLASFTAVSAVSRSAFSAVAVAPGSRRLRRRRPRPTGRCVSAVLGLGGVGLAAPAIRLIDRPRPTGRRPASALSKVARRSGASSRSIRWISHQTVELVHRDRAALAYRSCPAARTGRAAVVAVHLAGLRGAGAQGHAAGAGGADREAGQQDRACDERGGDDFAGCGSSAGSGRARTPADR